MSSESDSRVSQFRKGALELGILALLDRGELYGVEIVDLLAEHSGLEASAGTVYPLLSRLKKSGLLDSVWRESPVGPPRKYYALTPAGQDALAAMAATFANVAAAIRTIVEVEK